jgi:gamma-glutamyltranspeptidase / glutathione hydrolase
VRQRVELRDRQQVGTREMVSTGSASATLAALDVLAEGGTAIDAAITTSAMLTVAMPMASGPGGDAAVLIKLRDEPWPLALTSLGRAPSGASPAALRARGLSTLPTQGIMSATTPALIDAWFLLARRYATLPLKRLLTPAIEAASTGTAVTQQYARWAGENLPVLKQVTFARTYSPATEADAIGSTLRQLGLADLYLQVADGAKEPETFRRALSAAVHRLSEETGGLFGSEDCARDHARIEPALRLHTAGFVVSTTPAPTQGALLLQNLALYADVAQGACVETAEGIHLLAEAINQSYGWRLAHLGDPDQVAVPDPLAPAALERLKQGIDPRRRSPATCVGHYSEGDTTHFAIADRYGNAVSWVQSLGLGFGAGVGIPEWGLLLCNRLGRSTTLDSRHANCCTPGRRPVNTILPWCVNMQDGTVMLGGTPGGDAQAQWNAQTLAASLYDRFDPLRALSLPRWTYLPGSDKHEAGLSPQLQVDSTMSQDVIAELEARGHVVRCKAGVGGANRIVTCGRSGTYGLDDGRQEGLTAGR